MTTDVAVRETSRRRRVSVWIALGLVILVVGGIGGTLAGLGQWTQRSSLDPESAGALGTPLA